MKVYSIGRDTACDICINDSTDVISRRHAILNVTPTGKMTIVDQSHNGTYVNGIRISPNVPVPVTRKDSISFAHVARLDWNRVPKSGQAIKYAAVSIGAIIVIAVAGFGLKATLSSNSSADNTEKPAAVADTTKAQKEDTKTEEKNDTKDSDTEKEEKASDTKKYNKKEQAKKDKKENASDKKDNGGKKNAAGKEDKGRNKNNGGSNSNGEKPKKSDQQQTGGGFRF